MIPRLSRMVLAIVFVNFLATIATAQDVRTERVSFPGGQSGTMLQGAIRGYDSVDYILGASAGQRFIIDFAPDNDSAYFDLTAPGASEPLHIGSVDGNRYEGVVPSSGDYTISVYMMRNAARRDETAAYSMAVNIISGVAEAEPPAPDYADGSSGGPDFWQVTGGSSGDYLNLRAGPSTGNAVLERLGNGIVVRNLGCRMVGSQRWCQVENISSGQRGWAAGSYLREAAYVPGNDAPVPSPQPPVVIRPPVSPVYMVKCSGSSRICLDDASRQCRGSIQVIDSESRAGGLIDDTFPGPVTWYRLTFRCGPFDGKRAFFSFRGPQYRPPRPDHDYKPQGTRVAVRDMRRYCQGEASAKFSQRPREIQTRPVQPGNRGYVVKGEYTNNKGKRRTFRCNFGTDRRFLKVERT